MGWGVATRFFQRRSHAVNFMQRVSVCTPRHFLLQKQDAQRVHLYLQAWQRLPSAGPIHLGTCRPPSRKAQTAEAAQE